MKAPVAIVGIGELGSVFARGFLRCGHPVYPVLRSMDIGQEAVAMPQLEAVLVATGEADLYAVLQHLPAKWRQQVMLLQNELLPRDWLQHGITQPTVIAVWFEKKKGMDVKILLPSPVFGPHAPLIVEALQSIDIPTRLITDEGSMLFELVAKNVYILTTNIAGLVLPPGATVHYLHHQAREWKEAVAKEVIEIQFGLIGGRLEAHGGIQALMRQLDQAIEADLQHKCKGRSASARLARALAQAQALAISVPTLQCIAEQVGVGLGKQ